MDDCKEELQCIHLTLGELQQTTDVTVNHNPALIDRHASVHMKTCALCAGYLVGLMGQLQTTGTRYDGNRTGFSITPWRSDMADNVDVDLHQIETELLDERKALAFELASGNFTNADRYERVKLRLRYVAEAREYGGTHAPHPKDAKNAAGRPAGEPIEVADPTTTPASAKEERAHREAKRAEHK